MEKFDLILENAFYKAKATILEEAVSAEEGKRAELVLTEAVTSLQKVKDFVKQNKGKLAALAAAGLAAGAYGAGRAGYLGQGAEEAIKGFEGGVAEAAKKGAEGVKSIGEKLYKTLAGEPETAAKTAISSKTAETGVVQSAGPERVFGVKS